MSPRGTTLTSPTGPVRHTRQHPPRPRSTRPMRASRAHNSADTHNAIQYRAERDAHDRTHTGLTRRRSRQRAQRPANGRPEAPRARVHARESALARRSRRRLRRPRRSATCGPLARRPGRTACRSRGTWVRGGDSKSRSHADRPQRSAWEGSHGAHIEASCRGWWARRAHLDVPPC